MRREKCISFSLEFLLSHLYWVPSRSCTMWSAKLFPIHFLHANHHFAAGFPVSIFQY